MLSRLTLTLRRPALHCRFISGAAPGDSDPQQKNTEALAEMTKTSVPCAVKRSIIAAGSHPHQCVTTGVPTTAQLNSHAASWVRMLTQPWLIGRPKLLCQ